MSTTERGLGADELVARASGLFDLLRSNAARTNADRRVPDENIDAIREAGLLRLLNPKRFGGHEESFRTHVEVTAELGRACPSTGWVVALLNACNWYSCILDDQGRDEIWGADPDALVCGVVSPGQIPAERVEGGWNLSGRWGFASGCLHATWAYVPAPVIENGELVDLVLGFVPIDRLQIEDTWHVMGMRGTGSNTLVGENLFVPDHLSMTLLGPDGVLAGNLPNEHPDELLYRAPLGMTSGMFILGPVLGAARAARDHAIEMSGKRPIAYTIYTQSSKAVSTQMTIADACTRLDMAMMLGLRSADDCLAAAQPGGAQDMARRARARQDASYAAKLCRGIVESFSEATGASGAAEADLMQQLFRDVNTAALHPILQTATTEELYGAILCGEPPTNTFLL